jgi:hypothetical protein
MVYPLIRYHGPAHPDLVQSESQSGPRELDSRISDGIHVRLLWHPGDGHVSVAVHDDKTGDAFELPVREGEVAHDVYRHPYAYADGRRESLAEPAGGCRDGAMAA